METASRFWTRQRVRAVLWTTLLGVLGGPVGTCLFDTNNLRSWWAILSAARLGGIMGAIVAVFAFLFPKAEDDPSRWKKWGFAALVLGLAGGAVAAMLRRQGAIK
jgi:uncharacterized membrane protein YeaQ/YmgE (transglycosylase-associated protein family)